MKILGEQNTIAMEAASLSKKDIRELCQRLTEHQGASLSDVPFYLMDECSIVERITEWRRHLPKVKPFYAVKCNPDERVIAMMKENNCGFDVASKKEIEQVLNSGVDPDSLIFANPCKLSSHLKYAAAKNVQMMTFDNVNELKKIKKIHPTAKVVMRLSTDDSDSVCQFSQKFGAARADWPALIQTCRNLDLDLYGVSFHVGSGCRDVKQYGNSIKDAREVFDLASRSGLNSLELVDIGGGFPGYPSSPDEPSFAQLANEINSALKAHFSDLPVKVIAEPGRFMVASAYTLVTKVTSVRDTSDRGGDVRYYVNDGVYGSFNNILYDHAKPVPELLKTVSAQKDFKTCSIWGPSCDGLDRINDNLYFHALCEGDYLIWFDMGAYTLPCASEFNGFPTPRQYNVPRGASVERLRTASFSEFKTKCQEIGVEC